MDSKRKRIRRRKLRRRQGGKCWFCGAHIDGKGSIHHIIPRAEGGTDAMSNQALTHRSCHDLHHEKEQEEGRP